MTFCGANLLTQSGHRFVEWRLSSAKLPNESKERACASQRRPHARGGRLDDGRHAETPGLPSASRNQRDRHLCRRRWQCRRGARLH
jgi:hypothetical protein